MQCGWNQISIRQYIVVLTLEIQLHKLLKLSKCNVFILYSSFGQIVWCIIIYLSCKTSIIAETLYLDITAYQFMTCPVIPTCCMQSYMACSTYKDKYCRDVLASESCMAVTWGNIFNDLISSKPDKQVCQYCCFTVDEIPPERLPHINAITCQFSVWLEDTLRNLVRFGLWWRGSARPDLNLAPLSDLFDLSFW